MNLYKKVKFQGEVLSLPKDGLRQAQPKGDALSQSKGGVLSLSKDG